MSVNPQLPIEQSKLPSGGMSILSDADLLSELARRSILRSSDGSVDITSDEAGVNLQVLAQTTTKSITATYTAPLILLTIPSYRICFDDDAIRDPSTAPVQCIRDTTAASLTIYPLGAVDIYIGIRTGQESDDNQLAYSVSTGAVVVIALPTNLYYAGDAGEEALWPLAKISYDGAGGLTVDYEPSTPIDASVPASQRNGPYLEWDDVAKDVKLRNWIITGSGNTPTDYTLAVSGTKDDRLVAGNDGGGTFRFALEASYTWSDSARVVGAIRTGLFEADATHLYELKDWAAMGHDQKGGAQTGWALVTAQVASDNYTADIYSDYQLSSTLATGVTLRIPYIHANEDLSDFPNYPFAATLRNGTWEAQPAVIA
jgi:hypothetical protein